MNNSKEITKNDKYYFSEDFNYYFNYKTGYTAVWGKTIKDDPEFAPFPLLADMEITTICNGIGNSGPCAFCYKSNSKNGTYMPFTLAKRIIDKFPEHLTQIAFGTDAKLKSNPDWFKIFQYARNKRIVPNVTVADITKETASKLSSVCGAVAVSRYQDKDICYNSVKYLTDAGCNQVNTHILLSQETLPFIYETLSDIRTDKRLNKLNAIVLLSLKKKGRGINYHTVSSDDFSRLMDTLFNQEDFNFGFDSCTGHRVLDYIKKTEQGKYAKFCNPCESTRESCYINVHGMFYPCSFVEGTPGWEQGLDIVRANDFIEDIWHHPKTCLFRERLLMEGCRCPVYNVG